MLKYICGDIMSEFKFKKKYGQNFLKNQMVIYDIVDSIYPNDDDLVIEIGPGGGALTSKLLEKGNNTLCYEIDKEASIYLDKLESDRLHVIYDDFLKRDIKKDLADYKYNKLYIIGNLPYYITTPIITKIIESDLDVEEMVFMVQKEVAVRFSAKPGTRNYGSISVFLNYFYDIDNMFTVPKKYFYPVPNVDSAVIKLTSKKDRIKVDTKLFSKFVKDCFQFKRKNLRNNLFKYDREKIDTILREHDLSLDNRAEDMSYEIFVDIVNRLNT